MNTPENITSLSPNEVFVFGSNLRGAHGKGAARTARLLFGARPGVSSGPTGQCYAIPTKDARLWPLPLGYIQEKVRNFLAYAKERPHITFLVTKIGCGLAGFSPAEIAPFFKGHPRNVVLPVEFESC